MFEEYQDEYVRTPNNPDTSYQALVDFDESTLKHWDDSQNLSNFDAAVITNSNSLPLEGSAPQVAGQRGDPFASINDTLKKVGSLAVTTQQVARTLGQTVGAIEATGERAVSQFNAGRTDARRVVPAALWWETAPTTEKLALLLAAVGVYLALR